MSWKPFNIADYETRTCGNCKGQGRTGNEECSVCLGDGGYIDRKSTVSPESEKPIFDKSQKENKEGEVTISQVFVCGCKWELGKEDYRCPRHQEVNSELESVIKHLYFKARNGGKPNTQLGAWNENTWIHALKSLLGAQIDSAITSVLDIFLKRMEEKKVLVGEVFWLKEDDLREIITDLKEGK